MARLDARKKRAPETKENDATVIRRQLLWTLGLLLLAALLGWGWMWGQDNGWGNAAKAAKRKMDKAEAAFVAGRLDEAADLYAQVAKRWPQDPQAVQALTQEATALQQLGRVGESLQVLGTLDARLGADKSDLKAYTLLQMAKARKDLADFEGALQTYGRVRTEHPHTDWSGEAQSGIGEVLQAQRRYPEARAAFEVLVKELPGGFLAAEAQTSIGECWEAEGELKKAERAYQTVMDKYPSAVWDTAKARLEAVKKDLETKKAKKSSKG
jgi:tetratricopeptide (TPR) repeat protein